LSLFPCFGLPAKTAALFSFPVLAKAKTASWRGISYGGGNCLKDLRKVKWDFLHC